MKKTNNKGFTLVELIVVLVILAILAAILVPALLGYIDKAKEKKLTTNAEAAYVAAQAILNEEYGKGTTASAAQTAAQKTSKIKALTDIEQGFSIQISCGSSVTNSKHKGYIITKFTYHDTSASTSDNFQYAHWNPSNGQWQVDANNSLYGKDDFTE